MPQNCFYSKTDSQDGYIKRVRHIIKSSSYNFATNWAHSARYRLLGSTASNRNEYEESLIIKKPGGKVLPARRADNLVAIY
jgi:hypothetical protein